MTEINMTLTLLEKPNPTVHLKLSTCDLKLGLKHALAGRLRFGNWDALTHIEVCFGKGSLRLTGNDGVRLHVAHLGNREYSSKHRILAGPGLEPSSQEWENTRIRREDPDHPSPLGQLESWLAGVRTSELEVRACEEGLTFSAGKGIPELFVPLGKDGNAGQEQVVSPYPNVDRLLQRHQDDPLRFRFAADTLTHAVSALEDIKGKKPRKDPKNESKSKEWVRTRLDLVEGTLSLRAYLKSPGQPYYAYEPSQESRSLEVESAGTGNARFEINSEFLLQGLAAMKGRVVEARWMAPGSPLVFQTALISTIIVPLTCKDGSEAL